MPNTAAAHSLKNVYIHPTNSLTYNKTTRDLRQDKHAPERVRAASGRPSRAGIIARAQPMNTKTPRSQKRSTNRQTEQITGWVPKPIKAEVLRLAKQNGWSESKTVRMLVERGLANTLGEQHAVMLKLVIADQIHRDMQGFKTLLTWLLTRVAFDGAQTRIITKNILSQQPGITTVRLNKILEKVAKRAKENITRETPQLTEVVDAVERWMEQERKEQTANG